MRAALIITLVILMQAFFQPALAQGLERLKAINVTAWYTWPRFNGFDEPGVYWPPFPPDRRMPSTADVRLIASLGFSSIRLGVDPALYMGLEGEQKKMVTSQIINTVEQALDAGLDVVFDLHPNSKHTIYGQSAFAVRQPPRLHDYVEMIGEVAKALAVYPKGRVTLELMNEPRLGCSGQDLAAWQSMLDLMIAKASETAPDLPLVVSGACTSSIEGLLALDPGRWKRKDIYFTFHFYEPFPFTHQSAPFIPWPEKYLVHVPWPPEAENQDVAINVLSVPAEVRPQTMLKAKAVLAKYLRSGANAQTLRARLSKVSAWADEHGIERPRIFMGEFGVYGGLDGINGATCDDRAAWVSHVTSIADDFGFSWGYFHYDGPFGITVPETKKTDTAVLKALGLRATGECAP